MLQKDLLLEHKTVLGNIILPLLIQKVDKAEAIARADEILATFQLTAVRDKYPHELSGGDAPACSLASNLPFRAQALSLRRGL